MPIDDALQDIAGALQGPVSGPPVVTPSAPSPLDDVLADFAKTPEQLRAEIPKRLPQGGIARNVAAGANEAISSALGAPVDAITWAVNKLASPFTGMADYEFGEPIKASVPPSLANVPQPPPARPLIENPIGGSESIKRLMGVIGADPRNVAVGGTADSVARDVGGAAAMMAGPYLGARAAIANGVGAVPFGTPPTLPGAGLRMLAGPGSEGAGLARTAAQTAGNAAVGAGSELAGRGAEGLLPEDSSLRPIANFAGQLFGGAGTAGAIAAAKAAINGAINQGRNVLGPVVSEAYRKGLVADRLRAGASDPEAVQAALETPTPELVPGSAPTTYQLTGDQGIGQLERAARTQSPAPFIERAGEQNAARVNAVNALASEVAPAAMRDLLEGHLAALDAAGEADTRLAQQNAQQAFDLAGGRLTRDDYGALMRDQLEAAKRVAKQREGQLWQAIDPHGDLTINGSPVKTEANRIAGEVPSTARPLEGEELAIFGQAKTLGPETPFSEYAALRSRLLDATRQERLANGETPALRRMTQLRQAMDNTMSGKIDEVAAQEAQAVAAGTMSAEDVIAARLARDVQAHYLAQNARIPSAINEIAAGGNGGVYPGSSPAQGPSGVGGPSGETGAPTGRLGGAAGNPGLQTEPQPPVAWDEAAQQRYRAAADATRANAETFKNQTVGPVLTVGRNQPYRLTDTQVPERFMSSPEGVQAFLDAGGNRDTLREALVGDLRQKATNPDGTLNPNRYQSWLRGREGALRSFPELQTTLGDAAAAQTAVDAAAIAARGAKLDFQQSAARHFLNAEPAQAVQAALASKNPVADFAALSRMVAADPDAKAGLQRAVADYISQRFIGNTEALKSDQFQTFLKRNSLALRHVFSSDQMASMNAIAADLQRSNRSIAGSKLPGQSNTAQDLAGISGKMSVLRQYLSGGNHGAEIAAALGGYLLGGYPGAIGGAVAGRLGDIGRNALNSLKRAGIEKTDTLMTEALLDPDKARTILMVASPANRAVIAQRLGTQIGALTAVAGAPSSERKPRQGQQ